MLITTNTRSSPCLFTPSNTAKALRRGHPEVASLMAISSDQCPHASFTRPRRRFTKRGRIAELASAKLLGGHWIVADPPPSSATAASHGLRPLMWQRYAHLKCKNVDTRGPKRARRFLEHAGSASSRHRLAIVADDTTGKTSICTGS
jgi:hypothetical protein